MCIDVHIVTVCGKQARQLLHKDWKVSRREKLLLKLIKENRRLRTLLKQ